MEYRLEYQEGKEKKILFLQGEEYTLGKLAYNDFTIADNSISRRHCKFSRWKKGYRLADLRSTNGTYVNGKLIQKKKLKHGDEINVGRTVITYFCSAELINNIQDIDDQQISKVVPLSDKFRIQEETDLSSSHIGLFDSLALIGRKLLSSGSLKESFERVAEVLFKILKPNSLYVFSYQNESEQFHAEYIKKKGNKNIDQVTISKSIDKKAIEEKLAILSANTLDDSRFKKAESVIIYGIKSALSVPIWTKSSIYGLIYIDITDIERTFLAKDLEIVSVVAHLLGLSIESINNREKLTHEKKLRSRLERYHSPAIAEQIIKMQKADDIMSHKEIEASVLFLDIAGFTQRVEKIDPKEAGQFLNHFFTAMTEVIFEYEGTLDKYLGDGLMAVFGVPFEKKNHSQLAINAARGMIQKLDEINQDFDADNKIQIRIGIHSGSMICGNFGSPKRVDYTVLGNNVNIASRIESSIAKPGEVVVSETVYNNVSDRKIFSLIGDRKVAGISEPIRVYKLIIK
jgi:adenylate cyclase